MSEFLMPAVEEERHTRDSEPFSFRSGRASLMTPLGLVEGDVLTCLDRKDAQGVATLQELGRAVRWPTHLVLMAIGALIRAGLVQGIQQGVNVTVTRRKPLIKHP